jgi:hypothetical protein
MILIFKKFVTLIIIWSILVPERFLIDVRPYNRRDSGEEKQTQKM